MSIAQLHCHIIGSHVSDALVYDYYNTHSQSKKCFEERNLSAEKKFAQIAKYCMITTGVYTVVSYILFATLGPVGKYVSKPAAIMLLHLN